VAELEQDGMHAAEEIRFLGGSDRATIRRRSISNVELAIVVPARPQRWAADALSRRARRRFAAADLAAHPADALGDRPVAGAGNTRRNNECP
jgi:hypothetical protein